MSLDAELNKWLYNFNYFEKFHHRSRQLSAAELARALAFDDRESYLALVVSWKSGYAQLSADIRAAKAVFRAAQRTGAPAVPALRRGLREMAAQARRELFIRGMGKLKAGVLRDAARAALAGAGGQVQSR